MEFALKYGSERIWFTVLLKINYLSMCFNCLDRIYEN